MVLAVAAVQGSQFEALHLESVERSINLAGAYPTETIRATLHADADSISHFSLLLPLDYDSRLARIAFARGGKEKNTLSFHRSVYIYVRSPPRRTEAPSPTTA